MMIHLEEHCMINGAYYAEELRLQHQEIVKNRKGKLTGGVLFVQDNAPAHTSLVAMAAATKCSFKSFLIPCILQI